MYKPLFDGKHQIPNEMVIERMKCFVIEANKLQALYEKDKRATIALARELRDKLRIEYKNNDLQRIEKLYKDHELFYSYYRPAVTDAFVKTTGQLTQKNVYSFLYDVDDYMNYYMPEKYKD